LLSTRAKNLWTIHPLISGVADLTASSQGLISLLVGSITSRIVLVSGPLAKAALSPATAPSTVSVLITLGPMVRGLNEVNERII